MVGNRFQIYFGSRASGICWWMWGPGKEKSQRWLWGIYCVWVYRKWCHWLRGESRGFRNTGPEVDETGQGRARKSLKLVPLGCVLSTWNIWPDLWKSSRGSGGLVHDRVRWELSFNHGIFLKFCWGITDKIVRYLKCTLWWFNTCIYYEWIPPIYLMNTSIHHLHIYLFNF